MSPNPILIVKSVLSSLGLPRALSYKRTYISNAEAPESPCIPLKEPLQESSKGRKPQRKPQTQNVTFVDHPFPETPPASKKVMLILGFCIYYLEHLGKQHAKAWQAELPSTRIALA